jgi:hypothetical protein
MPGRDAYLDGLLAYSKNFVWKRRAQANWRIFGALLTVSRSTYRAAGDLCRGAQWRDD